MPSFRIGNRLVGDGAPVYFIADIAANHDGSLQRAKELIHLAAKSGADAAKFQNFQAPTLVSRQGFTALGPQTSHQAKWKKSVYEMYQDASVPWTWTEPLRVECLAAGIDYFSTPYDLAAVDMLDPYVPAFKIGSGDITWPEILAKVASKNKPVILSSGASDIGEVQRAVRTIQPINPSLALLQCNTNYTYSADNFKHIHLNVLNAYRIMFPDVALGLSDHTSGHATVLGAVALGARLIEKHFTDDQTREGSDHPFSMTPAGWREMVERTRELEYALGDASKYLCENERETIVVQRRCLRAARDLQTGAVLTREMIDVLRPAPPGSVSPYELESILGRPLLASIQAGEALRWGILG